MKYTYKLLVFVLTFLALSASAYGQSPREQLQQMVEQLQKTPSDNALRERIIKLAPTLKPSPALPDTATSFEGRARFAFEHAKSEADYLAAAQEYEKAIAAAPWVPNYYSDLCTIYEKAGKFEDAKRHCGFYLSGLNDLGQMTDAKRRIAGLEFGIEKANSPEAQASKQAAIAATVAEQERQRPSMEGTWSSMGFIEFQVGRNGDRFTFNAGKMMGRYGLWDAKDVAVDRQRVRFTVEQPACPQCKASYELSLSTSGNELTGMLWNQFDGSREPASFIRMR